MPDAYASAADLSAWLPSSVSFDDGDATRLLARAAELIDGTVRSPYTVDTNGLPTDTTIAQALNDASCAVVEQWLEVGEENDIDGLAGTNVAVAGKSGYVGLRAPHLAPRAFRILSNAGLLGMAAQQPTADAEFFDVEPDEVLS